MSLPANARLNWYEIVGSLGEGGMGEVYRARDTRLQRDVALKVLPATLSSDPDHIERFRHEARAVAALSHPMNKRPLHQHPRGHPSPPR